MKGIAIGIKYKRKAVKYIRISGIYRVNARNSVGKVLGQLAIVLVYTRTVLKTQYKTQFFKDTTHSQKQLSSIVLRGDIQRML